MYDPKEDQTIEHEIMSWDRTDYSPCDPCYVGVNDLALFQCRYCLALLDRKYVVMILQDEYGEDWLPEMRVLNKIRRLVNARKFDQLDEIYLTLTKDNGEEKTERRFYALKYE